MPPRHARLALEPSSGAKLLAALILTITAFTSLAPFFYVVSTSFKETRSLFSYPPHWLPDPIYFGNYLALFQKHPFGWWLANTLFVSAAVTLLKFFIDGMAAYALAKLEFTGKRLVVSSLLVSVAIPLAALLIPLFLITRTLGIIDTRLALILPPLANPLGVFMIRAFIFSVPDELIHSARMDGASEFEILRRVVVPLIRPGLVVHATFIFANQYTSFLWPLVAVRDVQKQVITVGISSLRAIFTVDWGLISAASLIAAIPLTVIFILFQRAFFQQTLAGALKE
jgi:ABC-type glycerol-3-phosphate transport system permease component